MEREEIQVRKPVYSIDIYSLSSIPAKQSKPKRIIELNEASAPLDVFSSTFFRPNSTSFFLDGFPVAVAGLSLGSGSFPNWPEGLAKRLLPLLVYSMLLSVREGQDQGRKLRSSSRWKPLISRGVGALPSARPDSRFSQPSKPLFQGYCMRPFRMRITIHGTPSSISIIAITKSGLENQPDSERENRKDGTLLYNR